MARILYKYKFIPGVEVAQVSFPAAYSRDVDLNLIKDLFQQTLERDHIYFNSIGEITDMDGNYIGLSATISPNIMRCEK